MAIVPILIYPAPVLRKKAAEIQTFDQEAKELIANLMDTVLADEHHIGLAATQIGVLLRAFVIRPLEMQEDGHHTWGEAKLYVNPKIVSRSEETEVMDEGCLSLPDLRGVVERPIRIEVEAQNEKGEKFTETLEGYPARQFMHENDHLNGVLFFDRMTKAERRSVERDLQRLKAKAKSK